MCFFFFFSMKSQVSAGCFVNCAMFKLQQKIRCQIKVVFTLERKGLHAGLQEQMINFKKLS